MHLTGFDQARASGHEAAARMPCFTVSGAEQTQKRQLEVPFAKRHMLAIKKQLMLSILR
jgi:hypothetical protein